MFYSQLYYFCFLKILNGPTYKVTVVGFGVAPAVCFSFTRHDFGACFVYRAGLTVQKKILTITNNDNKDVRYNETCRICMANH